MSGRLELSLLTFFKIFPIIAQNVTIDQFDQYLSIFNCKYSKKHAIWIDKCISKSLYFLIFQKCNSSPQNLQLYLHKVAPLIAAATWSQYLELLLYIALLETCLPTYFNDRKFKNVKIVTFTNCNFYFSLTQTANLKKVFTDL